MSPYAQSYIDTNPSIKTIVETVNQNIAFKRENYKDMKVILDDYTLSLFEAIANPAAIGNFKTVELEDKELEDAEEFLKEMMEKEEDEVDDMQIDICENMKGGKCQIGESCTKFHPVEEMEDDDPNNE